mmetsp:Transcript_42456/g.106106  ORF Transcript_42456/g.106106 Transcript_42456/m.106106 type:complete len:333 (-) Transcript_42456:979-1977(-)
MCFRLTLPVTNDSRSGRSASLTKAPLRLRCRTELLPLRTWRMMELSPSPIKRFSRLTFLTVPFLRPSMGIPHRCCRLGRCSTLRIIAIACSFSRPFSLRSMSWRLWLFLSTSIRSPMPLFPIPTPNSESLTSWVQCPSTEMAMAPSAGPQFMVRRESSCMDPSRRRARGRPDMERMRDWGLRRQGRRSKPSSYVKWLRRMSRVVSVVDVSRRETSCTAPWWPIPMPARSRRLTEVFVLRDSMASAASTGPMPLNWRSKSSIESHLSPCIGSPHASVISGHVLSTPCSCSPCANVSLLPRRLRFWMPRLLAIAATMQLVATSPEIRLSARSSS